MWETLFVREQPGGGRHVDVHELRRRRRRGPGRVSTAKATTLGEQGAVRPRLHRILGWTRQRLEVSLSVLQERWR